MKATLVDFESGRDVQLSEHSEHAAADDAEPADDDKHDAVTLRPVNDAIHVDQPTARRSGECEKKY